MKLIITETSWARELSLWGYEIVVHEDIFQAQIDLLNLYFKHCESISISISDGIEIDFDKNFLNRFIIKDVEQEEVDTLIELLGSACRGYYFFNTLVECCLDELEYMKIQKAKEYHEFIYGNNK